VPDGSSDQRQPDALAQLLDACDALDRHLDTIDHEIVFLHLAVSGMRRLLERLAP
jgi:hypothetical protein